MDMQTVMRGLYQDYINKLPHAKILALNAMPGFGAHELMAETLKTANDVTVSYDRAAQTLIYDTFAAGLARTSPQDVGAFINLRAEKLGPLRRTDAMQGTFEHTRWSGNFVQLDDGNKVQLPEHTKLPRQLYSVPLHRVTCIQLFNQKDELVGVEVELLEPTGVKHEHSHTNTSSG